ncbi:hypothetical protein HZS_3804, partial [Henneguya salminicola]
DHVVIEAIIIAAGCGGWIENELLPKRYIYIILIWSNIKYIIYCIYLKQHINYLQKWFYSILVTASWFQPETSAFNDLFPYLICFLNLQAKRIINIFHTKLFVTQRLLPLLVIQSENC